MTSILRALRRTGICRVVAPAACALSFATLLVARAADTLTPRDIDEAIEWGMYGNPAPYLLHYIGRPEKVNPVILGAIYTPFLRVALAAKAAREAGRGFTRSDVPPTLIDPVAYIAFRWYCCDHDRPDPESFDPFRPFDYKLAVPGDKVLRAWGLRATAAPLWIGRDVSLLASFGGELTYRDVVLIAAYPMSVLSTGHDFVIYREWPSPSDPRAMNREVRVGRVTRQDLTRWR